MATLMSLVGSARVHDLDIAAYLHDVIDRIAGLPMSRLPELLTDAWESPPTGGSARRSAVNLEPSTTLTD